MPALLRRTIAPAALSATLFLALSAAWLACGKSNETVATPSCTMNPFSCGMGSTCWPIEKSGAAACLASKSYKVRGDDCELILGDTSCGDGMVCATAATLKSDGSVVQSFCAAWCDTAHGKGCIGDETCTKLTLFEGAPEASVCVPKSLPRDHAMDGGR